MDKNLLIIKDFVEGKTDINAMVQICKTNADFRNYVKDVKNNALLKYDNDFLKFIDTANFAKPTTQLTLYLVFVYILSFKKIAFESTDTYIKNAQKYCSVIPDWLTDSASDWAEENILNKVPQNLNKTEQKKWIKEQIVKNFLCEKRHPSWVQGTEDWPQDNDGNFLTFVKQIEDGEKVTYIFANKKTGEKVEIVEFY